MICNELGYIQTYLYKEENAKGIPESMPEVGELFIEDYQLLPVRQKCLRWSGQRLKRDWRQVDILTYGILGILNLFTYLPKVEWLSHEREDVSDVGFALLCVRSVRPGIALSNMTAVAKIHEKNLR